MKEKEAGCFDVCLDIRRNSPMEVLQHAKEVFFRIHKVPLCLSR